MRTAVRTKYGPPDVLRLTETPTPPVDDDAILIRVRAVGLNASDTELLRAQPLYVRFTGVGFFRPKVRVLGSDVAGEVVSVGRNVTEFAPGDAVVGDLLYSGFGGLAEYVAVPADAPLVRKPSDVTFEEAWMSTACGAVSSCLKRRDIGPLVRGVSDHQHHVDDRLRGKAGDGGGSRVFELEDFVSKRLADPFSLPSKLCRPGRVILGKMDRAVEQRGHPNGGGGELRVRDRRALLRQARQAHRASGTSLPALDGITIKSSCC